MSQSLVPTTQHSPQLHPLKRRRRTLRRDSIMRPRTTTKILSILALGDLEITSSDTAGRTAAAAATQRWSSSSAGPVTRGRPSTS